LSLLAEDKLVVITHVAAQKELLEELAERAKDIPENTLVIVAEPKLDKRAKYYKQLKTSKNFEVFEQQKYDNPLPWMIEQAKAQGGKLERKEAQYLLDRVGDNKHLLQNEISKLVLCAPTITKENIDLLSEPNPQSTVFELVDAAFAGNKKKAADLYEQQRKQKVEPLAILGMIAWQLQVLAILKTAKGKSDAEIAKTAKLNPFVIRKNRALAQKMSLEAIKKLAHDALILDESLKTQSIDADAAMRHFLLQL
jgi:DNA polymerase-3 subunit delta